ncbi:hypothetical protein U271_01821 [Staphylococcus aureus F70893]|nr:hypothetical protein U271_01821 [Staphylococcus aureus F70893]EVX62153.1 hypothetical protein U280_02561 [Staphylococcus aureus F77047]EWW99054.1 hypothetical protein V308_01975 [Staphylococcus aureus H81433]
MIAPHFYRRIITLILWLVLGFLMSIVSSFIIHLSSGDIHHKWLFSVLGIVLYTVYTCIIVYKWKYRLRNDAFEVSNKVKIFYLITCIVIMIISSIIIKNNTPTVYDNSILNVTTLTNMFIFYVCFAPIVEETLCRGWFLSLFYNHHDTQADKVINIIASCVISACISTFMHGPKDLSTIAILFINGILAAILYNKTNHILWSIIFHMFVNALAWFGLAIQYF